MKQALEFIRKHIKFLLFALPAFFLLGFILFKDLLYLIISAASFFAVTIFVFPHFLQGKAIQLENIKKQQGKRKIEKEITSPVNLSAKFIKLKFIPNLMIWIVAALVMSFLALLIFLPSSPNSNIILGYFQSIYTLLTKNTIGSIIFVLIFFASFWMKQVYLDRQHKKKITLRHVFIPTITLIGSLITSFILMIIISLLTTNLLSGYVTLAPMTSGVTFSRDSIVAKLKNMDHAPKVVTTDQPIGKEIVFDYIKILGTNSYFVNNVSNSMLKFATISPILPKANVVLTGNTLIIGQLNADDLQKISPYLGYLLVKDYFKDRFIKSYPDISVMGRQEYLQYRDKQMDDKIQKVDDEITKTEDYINQLYGSISTDKSKISNLQSLISQGYSQRDSEYNSCLNAGYYDYYFGTFYHYYSQATCQSYYDQWNATIQQGQQSLANWQQQLQTDQYNLSQAQNYDKELAIIKDFLVQQKDSTPQELGVFENGNQIKVALDLTSPHAAADYLATLAHEYLHYASYVDDSKSFDYSFFEEGLTEYFARKVIKQDLNVSTNLGYPVLARLIKEMTKKIPESEFARVYFTKDESGLEALLNNAYGDNFYKDTQYYFEEMSYLPSDQALKVANNIIVRIGGTPMQEKDFFSTYSFY